MKKLFTEENIHFVFDVSLVIKAVLAALEMIGGILAYFISPQFLLAFITTVTADELADDPRDFVANYFLHFAQNFSVNTAHFIAFYLFGHGLIKLFVIIGLLRQKLWYYPLALVVFGLFIVYQLYRYMLTHSAWLLVITALDLVVIWLTWHEYRYLTRRAILTS